MPTLSQSRPGREPIRYLYTLALPITSASLVGALWFLVWGIREGSMPAMLAGLPGHWLPVLLGVEGTSLVLTQIIGVIPVMAAVGLLQDYLRVRPVWAWAYLPGFAIAPAFWLLGLLPVSLRSVLFAGCISLYFVSILLCLVGGVLTLRRWFRYRTMRIGS